MTWLQLMQLQENQMAKLLNESIRWWSYILLHGSHQLSEYKFYLHYNVQIAGICRTDNFVGIFQLYIVHVPNCPINLYMIYYDIFDKKFVGWMCSYLKLYSYSLLYWYNRMCCSPFDVSWESLSYSIWYHVEHIFIFLVSLLLCGTNSTQMRTDEYQTNNKTKQNWTCMAKIIGSPLSSSWRFEFLSFTQINHI